MNTVKLRDLPVGALFIRHDQFGDGKTIYVKLSDHGFSADDRSACQVGTTASGHDGPLMADVDVQQVEVGSELAAVAFCMAQSLRRYRTAKNG